MAVDGKNRHRHEKLKGEEPTRTLQIQSGCGCGVENERTDAGWNRPTCEKNSAGANAEREMPAADRV